MTRSLLPGLRRALELIVAPPKPFTTAGIIERATYEQRIDAEISRIEREESACRICGRKDCLHNCVDTHAPLV